MKLTPELLEPFVGQYQYAPGVVLTVSRDGTQLFAQLTGQPKLLILRTSDTDFEWRVITVKVQFVKGEDGKVIKVVHRQDGANFDAPKIK